MKLLTQDATLNCAHAGIVRNEPSQDWVTIATRTVLVATDPEGRDIDRCPNRGPQGIKPCEKTLPVRRGYSAFVTVSGHAVCLDDLWGLTDGTPPGIVRYAVVSPGQGLVSGDA